MGLPDSFLRSIFPYVIYSTWYILCYQNTSKIPVTFNSIMTLCKQRLGSLTKQCLVATWKTRSCGIIGGIITPYTPFCRALPPWHATLQLMGSNLLAENLQFLRLPSSHKPTLPSHGLHDGAMVAFCPNPVFGGSHISFDLHIAVSTCLSVALVRNYTHPHLCATDTYTYMYN